MACGIGTKREASFLESAVSGARLRGLTCDQGRFVRSGGLVSLSCGDNLASKLQPQIRQT
jgi:hypothetical protein